MELRNRLKGSIIGLDTAPLIYWIEENPKYLELTSVFFEAMSLSEFTVVTSTITLLEVLVHPLRLGKLEIAQKYRNILLNSNNLNIISVSPYIAELASQLRANYNLKTPDAIQLAVSISQGASFFLTNDLRLDCVENLEILCLDKL